MGVLASSAPPRRVPAVAIRVGGGFYPAGAQRLVQSPTQMEAVAPRAQEPRERVVVLAFRR